MRIAVPTNGGMIASHFGRCDLFTIVEVDMEAMTILGTESVVPPPHEPGVLPAWLANQGCSLVIAGGMGHKAQQMFEANGIGVILGAPAGTPEELVALLLDKRLVKGENLCDRNGHGDGHRSCGKGNRSKHDADTEHDTGEALPSK